MVLFLIPVSPLLLIKIAFIVCLKKKEGKSSVNTVIGINTVDVLGRHVNLFIEIHFILVADVVRMVIVFEEGPKVFRHKEI